MATNTENRTFNDILGEQLQSSRQSPVAVEGAEVRPQKRTLADVVGDQMRGVVGDQMRGVDTRQRSVEEEPSILFDPLKSLAGGAVSSTGGAIAGIERAFRKGMGYVSQTTLGNYDFVVDPTTGTLNAVRKPQTQEAPLTTEGMTSWLKEKGNEILASRTKGTQEAIQKGRITGTLWNPQTWDFGEDQSARSLLNQGLEGFGSLLPILVGTVLTKSPVVGTVTGAGMTADNLRDNARNEVTTQLKELKAQNLLSEIPRYAQLRDSGVSEEEAFKEMAQEAGNLAFDLGLLIGGAGGYATGKILGGIPKTGLISGTAIGALEEGTQEVTEDLGASAAVQSVGLDPKYGENSLESFILGALAGGPVGGIGGLHTKDSGPGEIINDGDLGPGLVDPVGDAPQNSPTETPTKTPKTPAKQPDAGIIPQTGINDGGNASNTPTITENIPEVSEATTQTVTAIPTEKTSAPADTNTNTNIDTNIDTPVPVNAPALIEPDNTTEPFAVPGMTYIKSKTGSAKGGVFTDYENTPWMVKQYTDDNQVNSEIAAMRLMNVTSATSTEARQVMTSDQKPAIATKYLTKSIPFDPENAEMKKSAQRLFVKSAWLANWDVVGLNYDNLVYDTESGQVRAIDLGGALDYRAQGKKKGLQFGNTVKEIETLRDAKLNPQAAKVFAGITEAEIKKQVEDLLLTLGNDEGYMLKYVLAKSGITDGTIETKLKARLFDLADKYGLTNNQHYYHLATPAQLKKKGQASPRNFTKAFKTTLSLKTDIGTITSQAELYHVFNEEVFYSYKNNNDMVSTVLNDPNLMQLTTNSNYNKWKVGNKLWWDTETHKLKLFDNVKNLSMQTLYQDQGLLPPVFFHGVASNLATPIWDEATQSWQVIESWDATKQGKGTSGGDTNLGMFLSDNPKIAAIHGNSYGTIKPIGLVNLGAQNVQPFVVNLNPFVFDYGNDNWKSSLNIQLAQDAQQQGHDSLLTVNVKDTGGLQTQLIIFDPHKDGSKVKSPFAQAFDAATNVFKQSLVIPGLDEVSSNTRGLTKEEVVKLQETFDNIYGKGIVNVETFTAKDLPGYNAFFGKGPKGLIIGLRNTLSVTDAAAKLHHEAIHFLKMLGHFNTPEGKKQWRILSQHVKGRISKEVQEQYTPDVWVEEEIARFVERVAKGEIKPKNALRKAVKYVRDFFVALGNWGRGLGFKTPEQIAQKIMGGNQHHVAWIDATENNTLDRAEVTIGHVFAAAKKLNVPVSKKQQKAVDWYGRITKYAHTVKQLAEKNLHLKWLQEYVQHAGQWHIKKMTWMARADGTVSEWNNLSFTEQENLANAFFDIESEVEYRDPDIVKQGKLTPKEAELLKKNNVSKKGLVVYLKVRSDFRAMLDEVERVATESVQKSLANNLMSQLLEIAKIKKEFAQLRKSAYFPFARFGTYTIVVKGKDGKTVYVETFEREKSRNAAVAGIKKKFPKDQGYVVATSKLSEESQAYQGIPQSLLVHMKDQLKLTKKQMESLEEMIVHSMPSVSFKNHFTKKERVAGFSRDALRAYAEYMWHGANHIARIEYGPLMEESIAQGEEDIKTRITQGVDSTNARKIVEYLEHHKESIMNPKEDWAGLRALGFMWWLGYNVKSAVLNFTQVPLVTYSHLGAHFGTLKATSELSKTMANIRTIYRSPTKAANKHTALLGKMLGLGIKQGFIDESFAANLAGLAEGSNLTQSVAKSKVRKLILGFNYYGGFMFQTVEKLNRIVSFTTAMELAMKNPDAKYIEEVKTKNELLINDLVNNEGLTYEEAVAFAAGKDTVDATQFNYSAWARPRIMEGRTSAFLTFFMFTQNMLWFIGNNPGNSRYLLMLLLFAGMTGMPGYDDLEALVKFAGRQLHQDWNIEKELREVLVEMLGDNTETFPPDLFLDGISRHGFGLSTLGQMAGMPIPDIDMSASVGMGSPLPIISPAIQAFTQIGTDKNFDDIVGEFTQEGIGASFGIFAGIMKSMADMSSDPTDFKRWEPAMPSALSAMSKAARYYYEGKERNRSGAQLVAFDRTDPEQMAEIAVRALGFTPTRVSQAWDHTMMQREAASFWAYRRRILLDQWEEARRGGDKNDLKSVLAAVRRYNKQVPKEFGSLRMTKKSLEQSYDARRRNIKNFEANRPNAKMMRPVYKDVDKLYPEVEERVPSGN